jgi:hypothetical protein
MTDKQLQYRCALLPEKARNSRPLAFTELLKAGWDRELLERELDNALAYARSQAIVNMQEKYRRRRAAKKANLRGDDALDLMFVAAGADPGEIPTRPGKASAPSWKDAKMKIRKA